MSPTSGLRLPGVSRETSRALTLYVDLLLKWNRRINLIGRSTVEDVWSRHIVDSLQVLNHAAGAARWVDFGSGAGLPGLPLALALRERSPNADVLLIESDQRKAAFLREAIRLTGAPARLVPRRIEDVTADPPRTVTARALAGLDLLLSYAAAWLGRDGHAFFLKGEDTESELTAARRSWTFHVKHIPSETREGSVILDISEVRRIDVATS